MRTTLRIGKGKLIGVKCAWLSGFLSARKLRSALSLAVLLSPSIASAIVFPLAQEPYDDKKNLIDYSYPHSRGQEIGYYTNQAEGYVFLGTAIAPNWFITANHTALYGGLHTYYDSQGKAHDVIKVLPNLGLAGWPDMALVQVAPVLPFYSRIARSQASSNQQGKVYGLGPSSWAHGSIRGSSGQVQARYPVGTGPEQLRWGLAKFGLSGGALGINWPFTASDPDIGTDCAGLVTGDSGGPIFLRQNGTDRNILIGVGTTGFMARNVNTKENSSANCVMAMVWDGAGIYACSSSQFTSPSGGGGAQDVGAYAAKIYETISPPIRLAAAAAAAGWTNYAFGGNAAKATNYSTASTIDISGVTNAAPQAVYQNLTMIPYARFRSQIRYVGNNLLRNESYKVRIHFSSIPIPGLDQTKVTEAVKITDANTDHLFRNITPYAGGLNKATVMDLPDSFIPTVANQISIEITASSPRTFAVVSGIEILLNQ